MTAETFLRLAETVRAACPDAGVSMGVPGDPSTVETQLPPGATEEQRVAVADAVTAFDWSDSATEAWVRRRAVLAAVAAIQSPDMTDPVAVAVALMFQSVCDLTNNYARSKGDPPPLLAGNIMQHIGGLVGV
jgi:hypothetical protein